VHTITTCDNHHSTFYPNATFGSTTGRAFLPLQLLPTVATELRTAFVAVCGKQFFLRNKELTPHIHIVSLLRRWSVTGVTRTRIGAACNFASGYAFASLQAEKNFSTKILNLTSPHRCSPQKKILFRNIPARRHLFAACSFRR